MKLNKIKISGIFNLKDVEISLDDLSALIAPNNYGKSNVLRAIDFGVFFMEASLKRKLSLMRNRSLIPINTALEGTPFSFELEGEFSNGEKTFSFVYGYSFEWWKTSKDDGARIIGEYLRMKSDDDLKFRSYINREDTNVAYYLASPTGRCSKQLLVDNNILALNKLANFDDLFYIDSIRQLNRLDVREIGTLQHPDSLFNIDMKDLFIEMLDDFSNATGRQTPDIITEKVASMSCKAAVKGNDKLTLPEINKLIDELLSLDNPYNCPHGRPTIISMSKYEIEKKFKRIV